ncbi:MAG: flagellar hook-basal body complex protein [Candidatus Omnitrophica bacterium]|nr:flagellar hook-basal body complex protein [Candidatus Omnitrophota bacterium]
MLRSMFTAISGMQNHQVRLDTVANNIANINTTGFKRSRVSFEDILSQTISGASRPTDDLGGVNPRQVGLGMTVASIDTIFTQGNLQLTGVNTDLAIQGDGFFILKDPEDVPFYTRAGNFTLDAGDPTTGQSRLVNTSNGYFVQGWNADSTGTITPDSDTEDVIIPLASTIEPNATSNIAFANNLDGTETGEVAFSVYTQTYTETVEGNVTVSWTVEPTGTFNQMRVTGELSGGASPQWGSTGTDTLTYTFTVDSDPTSATYGQITADTGPGAQDTIDPDGDADADDITVDLLNVGDDLLAGTNQINVVGPDTVDNAITATLTPPTHSTSINVYDSLGNVREVTFTFTKTANLNWHWTAGGDATAGDGTIQFDTDGSLLSSSVVNAVTVTGAFGAPNFTISPDFTDSTQYASESTLIVSNQDGYQEGTLSSFTIGNSGEVMGIYTNGLTRTLAQVAMATFQNPGGLLKEGENMFSESVNSGIPQVGTANSAGRGEISAGTLEMSNVDIAQEFVDMITAQRGFQANSRSITTSDEILQEVIALKR